MLHLGEDGTERLVHDVLPYFTTAIALFFIAIISSRRNETPTGNIALGVADYQHTKHIDLLGIEGAKGREMYLLLWSPCLSDDAHGRLGGTPFQQKDFAKSVKLPVTSL